MRWRASTGDDASASYSAVLLTFRRAAASRTLRAWPIRAHALRRISGVTTGLRPLPAAVSPARLRSRMRSRSNGPRAPNSWKMSRPPGPSCRSARLGSADPRRVAPGRWRVSIEWPSERPEPVELPESHPARPHQGIRVVRRGPGDHGHGGGAGVAGRCPGKDRLDPSDLELIEINEAFAAQDARSTMKWVGIRRRSNVNGGAIALGHPIGASGARMFVTLLHEMGASAKRSKGLAALCIGGGRASRWPSNADRQTSAGSSGPGLNEPGCSSALTGKAHRRAHGRKRHGASSTGITTVNAICRGDSGTEMVQAIDPVACDGHEMPSLENS